VNSLEFLIPVMIIVNGSAYF